ncbi:MAG: 4Fe-4S dicluster domain-containing protein [Candidatus Omnitrophota bacterium]
MRYPKLRELKEAIRSLFSKPYTTRFPYEQHKPYERFRGKPEFHVDDCVGCTACVQVCPAGALSFKDEAKNGKTKRVLTVRWDICIYCGQCEANCLTGKGIVLSREFDLATTGKREDLYQTIEKEVLLCDCCKEVIMPLDQIKWVANKLGPLCFTNASVMLFYLRNLSLAWKEKFFPKEEAFLRSDRVKLLCPRCRRQAVITS